MSAYDIKGACIADKAFYNVKEYGALGNGVADDYKAIQTLLTAVGDAGGIIFFPKGTYCISATLMAYSNQTLYFVDAGLLNIHPTDAIGCMLTTYVDTETGGYNCTHDFSIIGCKFDGGDTTNKITLLAFGHAKHIHVKGCTFVDVYNSWHNIECNSSENVLIEDCDFIASRNIGGTGGRLQIDNARTGAYVRSFLADYTACKNVEIRGCRFSGSATKAIESHAGTDGEGNGISEYVRIHECVFEGCSYGVQCSATDKVDCYDNTFINTGYCMNLSTSGTVGSLHDNRIENATTISNNNVIAYDNVIDGTLAQ